MTFAKRIEQVLISLGMIAVALFMFAVPASGLDVIALVFSVSLDVFGIRALYYYLTMARYMVGGKAILFVGVFALDIGMFTATLAGNAPFYIILYLLGANVFTGAVSILRAFEAKGYGAHWKLTMASGILDIWVGIVCVAFIRSPEVAAYLYAANLIRSALTRIISAFRRTAIVYIQ